MKHFPWLSIAVGLLVYLITGSAIAGLVAFVVIQSALLLFLAVIMAIVKDAAKRGNLKIESKK